VRPRDVTVRLRVNGRVLSLRIGDLSEYWVLHEVLVDEAYARGLPDRAETVVDLGSNVGIAAAWFATRWPGARIVAVEPNPALQARLAHNVAGFAGVRIMPVAVSATRGSARLATDASGTWSGTLGDEGTEVQTVTLADVLDGIERVDVLKCDIEGAEFDVLPSAPLERIGMLVGEIHDPARVDEITDPLGAAGFQVSREAAGDERYVIVTATR
jgi:FkbM family methyltransferase